MTLKLYPHHFPIYLILIQKHLTNLTIVWGSLFASYIKRKGIEEIVCRKGNLQALHDVF